MTPPNPDDGKAGRASSPARAGPGPRSITVPVVAVLVLATTLLLGFFGIANHIAERDRRYGELQDHTTGLSAQLAEALVLPLWSFSASQVNRVMESAMTDRNLRTVLIRQSDLSSPGREILHVRTRDNRWGIVERDSPPPAPGEVVRERSIVHGGATLGTITVVCTPRFVDESLRRNLVVVLVFIGALDLLLILVIYGLLWRVVIGPLKEIERCAVVVSRGGVPEAMLPDSRFMGELAGLRDSHRKMVDILQHRFDRQKQAEAELQGLNATLEARVVERTAKLELANREMAVARTQAETANRAKSTFLANMSHELRTPLNAILGYSQMMLRDCPPGAPSAETLRIINRSGEHLLGLINSVLDLAKIESRKYTLEPEDFDLGRFVRELVDILHRRAEDKGLTLTLDQSSSFPRHVRADRNKLRQVLINIVGNAIKFTEKGGVTLKLATVGPLRGDGSGELVFAVSDTGPGIHPEDMERIFQPFEQAAHRPKAEGTGLGRARAREVVRLMGGEVRVTSEYGRGSTFTFSIAYTPVDEAGLQKMQAPPPGEITGITGAAGLRVLIVEDHPDNRVLLRKIIEPFGFGLAEAENGEVAVRLATAWKPHLVLMDRRMPVMDGVAATRLIRALPEGGNIRLVAVTAEAFTEDRVAMMEAGCDAFVRKPYLVDELLETVASLLPVKLVRSGPVEERSTDDSRDGVPVDEGPARAAFAGLPAELAASVRVACEAADADRVAALLAAHPEAAAAAAPFLHTYRLDLLAALLSPGGG